MLEKYLESSKEALNKFSIFSPTLRLKYRKTVTPGQSDESVSGIIYGTSPGQIPENSKAILKEHPDLNLSLKLFPDQMHKILWNSTPGKLSIIAFVNSLTEEDKKVLKNWENDLHQDLQVFVVDFTAEKITGDSVPFKVLDGTDEIKDSFKISEFPWCSVVYDSYEVVSCGLKSMSLKLLSKLLDMYTKYESIQIYSLPALKHLSLWDYEKRKEKKISVYGTIVLDFWDDSCIDFMLQDQSDAGLVRYYKIYAGSQTPTQKSKYGLGIQGIDHPTATELKIIDVPTTVILANGTIIWKGNKLYVDFKSILEAHLNKTELELQSEIITQADLEPIIQNYRVKTLDIYENNQDIDITLEINAECELDVHKVYQEKYRSVLISNCKNKSEKNLVLGLYESLKAQLPNLRYTINVEENQKDNESLDNPGNYINNIELDESKNLLPEAIPSQNSDENPLTQFTEGLNPIENAQEFKPIQSKYTPIDPDHIEELNLTEVKETVSKSLDQYFINRVNQEITEELQHYKNLCISLQASNSKKDQIISNQKKIIADHKKDSVSNMQARINTMIEEKVKIEAELEKANKNNKELAMRLANHKKEYELTEINFKKRDNQIEILISKIKSLENEINGLKNELKKKNTVLLKLQTEANEVIPIKEVRNLSEKQSKHIEDLKKIVSARDTEISIMKGIIKTLQQSLNQADVHRSPGKLPPIKGAKSTGLSQKYSVSAKSNFTAKNSLNADFYKPDEDIESVYAKTLQSQDVPDSSIKEYDKNDDDRIKEEESIKEEEERIKEEQRIREEEERINEEQRIREEQRIKEEERLEEEKRLKEQERVKKELEREEIERNLMLIEEKIRKDEDARLAEEERLQKEAEEKTAKINAQKIIEESKKGKGKAKQAPKSVAKTGAKKK